MTATRRAPPLQIFQDPDAAYAHHEIAEADAHFLAAFAPLTDVSSNSNTLLNPPASFAANTSPHKTDRRSSSPPPHALSEANFNSILIPPPAHAGFVTDSLPKKKMRSPKRQTMAPPAATYSSIMMDLPATFPTSTIPMDKENMSPAIFGEQGLQHSDPVYSLKPERKRPMQEPPTLKSSKKQKLDPTSETPVQVPEPENMPPIVDDGSKPGYSYSQLIGLALLHAQQRRLTLAQIYKWISDNFRYYSMGDAGWQNSIRHNLSLNKAFIKQDRPKNDPGKGNYWKIVEGQEHIFWNKPQRRNTMSSASHPPPMSDPPRPTTAPSHTKHVDSSKFPEETELSSDGTIPCSDPCIHDGQDADNSMPPPPTRNIRSSPPPAEMNSSPPQPISTVDDHKDTPPPALRFPPQSRSGGRSRKFAGLGDSGYYSSIESSATKAYPGGHVLTSEADHDRPNMKLGRAELEIARIRGSSYDSPSKPGQHKKAKSASHLVSSSPFRAGDDVVADRAPLTPPVLFKRPVRPPPSVSPNTNLKNHRKRMRELIGTPENNIALNDSPFRPSFELPDPNTFTLYEDHPSFDDAFDVFKDASYFLETNSPDRTHSAKRPRLERAATSTSALADITGTNSEVRVKNKDPFWKGLPMKSQSRLGSPLRGIFSPQKQAPRSHPQGICDENTPFGMSMSQPLDIGTTDFSIFADLPSDGSEEGLDILQGFQKIGAPVSVAPNGSPVKQLPRPGLGRSSTSLF